MYMMGDRDFRSVIVDSISAIREETNIKIDSSDKQTIYLEEVVQCLRRSYYDRTEPEENEKSGFNDLFAGLLRKVQSGTFEPKDYQHKDISLKGQADVIADDVVLLFRGAPGELDSPKANDVLYLNACMWIYDKIDGMVIYLTTDNKETTFSISRNKKMFEEVIRRVTVLHDLLKDNRVPILEPSEQCSKCQYYERCFIKKMNTKQASLSKLFGLGNKD